MRVGTLFRLRVHSKCYNAFSPYDTFCDETVYGTGFVIEIQGERYIMTAHHVIERAKMVSGVSHDMGDGEARQLIVVGMQPHVDIALLKPSTSDFDDFLRNVSKPFRGKVGESSALRPKDRVTVLGFANADQHLHTTTGTVSGRTNFPLNRIQTDAVINHGCSGGPVVSEDGVLLGLATSGMDDMQITNHFTGYDEMEVAVSRILKRCAESEDGVGRELGLFVNAVLKPISASALSTSKRGGALVTGAIPNQGLLEGDVILAVKIGTEMLDLDSNMMILNPMVWSEDRLDFRIALDRLTSKNHDRRMKWEMRVMRDGEEKNVGVIVGPDRLANRCIFPDCEPLSYVLYFGLVIQTKRKDHLMQSCPNSENTKDILESFPIITHVRPNCPFDIQESEFLKGARLHSIVHGKEIIKTLTTLGDPVVSLKDVVDSVQRIPDGADVVIILFNGSRVGARWPQIKAYRESAKHDDGTVLQNEKLHRVLLPDWKQVNYSSYEGDGSDPMTLTPPRPPPLERSPPIAWSPPPAQGTKYRCEVNNRVWITVGYAVMVIGVFLFSSRSQ